MLSLPHLYRGKVRDLYAVDDDHLLMVASDRLSAFDVVLDQPIPGKGALLTALSTFWFNQLSHLVPHHLSDIPLKQVVRAEELPALAGRALVVRRLTPLPCEAIVRGYLAGSGWKDYQRSGQIGDIRLPVGLRLGERLPEAIFTPSTKAAIGIHDENMSFTELEERIGPQRAAEVRQTSLALYHAAAEYAAVRGILIADTKFEFGLDAVGQLVWMDEALTPDSSRFWPAQAYAPGHIPPSFDKQIVRDWLETSGWNKRPPSPQLPAEIIARTVAQYRAILDILLCSTPCGKHTLR